MSTRRPSPPPPPPDPLDAASHFHERAKRHAAEFRYSDEEFDETTVTGQHPPININLNVDRTSGHEIVVPHAAAAAVPEEIKKPNAGGLAAAIILLASSLAAICKALGWL